MKRVLLITSTFPLSEEDTQVPWLGKLMQELHSRGVEIDILVPAYKGSPSYNYFGIRVYRYRYAPKSLEILTHGEGAVFKLRKNPFLFLVALSNLLFGVIAVIKRVKHSHYDVIHVNWPFPQGIFGLVGKWLGSAKLVLTFYGAEFTLVRKIPFGRLILRFIIERSDKVVAISRFTADKVKNITNVPVVIIPFTSPISNIYISKQTKKSRGLNRILFVGRLIERKGASYLIDAMPLVLKSMEVQLDIVGEGPLADDLQRQIKERHLQKSVFLRGRVNDNKLRRYYSECDVFVLPSITDKWGDTEGLGVVLLEAMVFGKPVVASNVGGIVDVVRNNKNGILVDEKDSPSLARVLIKLFKDHKLANRLGKDGAAYVKKNFSWEKIISDTIKIYNERSVKRNQKFHR